MIPKPLVVLEYQLRRAVEAHQFDEAARLVTQYCQLAERHLKSLPNGSASGTEVAVRVRGVLEWSNLMLLAARAAIADRLSPLPLISRYLKTPESHAHMRIEA